MGYRHYFYKVQVADVKAIENISLEELQKRFANEWGYIDIDDVIKQTKIFEFGKLYFDNTVEQINSTGKRLFKNQDVVDYFSDNDFYVVGKEGLLKAIDIFANKVAKFYRDLDGDNNETKCLINDRIKQWTDYKIWLLPYDHDKDGITKSREYEYQFFNLIHLLQMIDWEKETILFYGY